MKFRLEERTVRAVLNLPDDILSLQLESNASKIEFAEFKEQVMSALSDLQAEIAETREGVGKIGTAVTALVEKYNQVADKLAKSVTEEQIIAAKSEFDQIQGQLQAVADAANAVGAGEAPPPLPDNPGEPLPA